MRKARLCLTTSGRPFAGCADSSAAKPAPRDPTLGIDEVHLWRVGLAGDIEGRCPIEETLSADERARARQFRFDTDRHRFLTCRSAVRAILAAYTGVPPSEILFAADANGKPVLDRDRHGHDIRFNVSHSGALALLAVTRGRADGR